MHIVVVVNGELPSPHTHELTQLVAGADQLVAVDGGLAHCADLGVWPSVLIGDLDSAPTDLVEQAQNRHVRVLAFPTDKNATDLELALEFAAEAGATKLTVVAAFGGRLDHELATVALLASDRWNAMLVAATDGHRILHVVRSSCDLALAPGSTISLVPWQADVAGVTTHGLQWPLHRETLAIGSTRGVSNIVEESSQRVTIVSGVLLVIADPTQR